jgi:hypothetical protein
MAGLVQDCGHSVTLPGARLRCDCLRRGAFARALPSPLSLARRRGGRAVLRRLWHGRGRVLVARPSGRVRIVQRLAQLLERSVVLLNHRRVLRALLRLHALPVGQHVVADALAQQVLQRRAPGPEVFSDEAHKHHEVLPLGALGLISRLADRAAAQRWLLLVKRLLLLLTCGLATPCRGASPQVTAAAPALGPPPLKPCDADALTNPGARSRGCRPRAPQSRCTLQRSVHPQLADPPRTAQPSPTSRSARAFAASSRSGPRSLALCAPPHPPRPTPVLPIVHPPLCTA